MGKEIFLCAINNIQSGICDQDCSFCAQSSKFKANIDRYQLKPIETILQEAKIAIDCGALGYCLVTSGRELDEKKVKYLSQIAIELKNIFPKLNLIGCAGIASLNNLKKLKESGFNSYNHNLETSKEFYGSICSTHSWQERFETCLNVKKSGLNLCSGGIFGLGETQDDRQSLMKSLTELNPDSIPINFFHPNPSLPLPQKILDIDEALNIVKYFRQNFGKAKIMVAGGREITLKERWLEVFDAGADAIVIGDYLTTSGEGSSKTLKTLLTNQYKIAQNC